VSFEQRFTEQTVPIYREMAANTSLILVYYHENDSAKFFQMEYRDLTSLFEHYRGIGGYFRTNEDDSISFVNLLYHTPRFTKAEKEMKFDELFREMVASGSVISYIGNASYIHTPNDDFYYDTVRNRWDYAPTSSWNFLKEEQDRYAAENGGR
jgi:hypothetical protein